MVDKFDEVNDVDEDDEVDEFEVIDTGQIDKVYRYGW